MSQWLRALDALAADTGLLPITHTRLTILCNSCPRGFSNLFWTTCVPGTSVVTHSHAHRQRTRIYIKQKCLNLQSSNIQGRGYSFRYNACLACIPLPWAYALVLGAEEKEITNLGGLSWAIICICIKF